ncbi:hypothetical protein Lesp01_26350 [Lentzea sp. NBRC 102530]|nr:hypothetical protein Lesp01_26350 [Lentzea sp. NBRC 102530]
MRLQDFVDRVFESLTRAEQRRWARTYLRGLVHGNGRRTPRGLARAEQLPAAAANGLHQFINGSPWDWEPVRRNLARQIAAGTTPYAWTTAELIIPKRGQHSVGVHQHVAAGTDRPVNCQRSLGFFLATDAGSFPVGWSLVLRGVWESDHERRDRARIPATEYGHPVASHVMDFADSAAADPALPDVPWALDLVRCEDATGVLAGLVRRGLDFACEVDQSQPLVTGRPGAPAVVTVGELMESRLGQRAHLLTPPSGHRGSAAVKVYAKQARLPLFGAADERSRTVRVLEWPNQNRGQPSRYWITSCTSSRVGKVLSLARARIAALATIAELQEHFGALDFEGRSFPGWHHHMTMASAAYAYRTLPSPSCAPLVLSGTAC